MCERRVLSFQLDRIKAHWPNLPTGNTAFDGYYDLAQGYTNEEVESAITLILREYDQHAHPKPATVAQFLRRVSQRKGDGSQYAMADGVYCPCCGTRELVDVADPGIDTSLWGKIRRAFFAAFGLINDTQPYLVFPSRMHPRCLPHCRRVAS